MCVCVCTSYIHSCESGYEFVFMHACTCVTGHEHVYVCVIFMINHKYCKYFEMQTLQCSCVNITLLQTRNLSMAELLEWEHLRGSSPHIHKVSH